MSQRIRAALYARVSSDSQAKAHTIGSQMAALLEQAKADGCPILEADQFIDDGYSGSTLLRPGLERLRDQAAAGNLDRVYVLAPDRLARKAACQAVLLEEFARLLVEIRFLNQPERKTPEDSFFLDIQGLFAEFERLKIQERSRRGKLHRAREGSVSVFSSAPYGYRYVTKAAGNGTARWEICPEQASVVRQIFEWVGAERLTLGEVARRLAASGIASPKGAPIWNRSSLADTLANPAYTGHAGFGRTRIGPARSRLRPVRGHPEQPRQCGGVYQVPGEEWIPVDVPALVSQDLFDTVREQVRESQLRARARKDQTGHLLQGLLVCGTCGRGCARKVHRSGKERAITHAYFRCLGSYQYHDGSHFLPTLQCPNPSVPAQPVEQAVWDQVKALMNHPGRLEQEYHRRLQGMQHQGEQELAPLRRQTIRIGNSISRLIDSYAEGLLEKEEFEPRIKALRQQLAEVEARQKLVREGSAIQDQIRFLVGQFQTFAEQMRGGLESMDFEARRNLVRTLVKRVEIGPGSIHIVLRVNSKPPPPDAHSDFLYHCPGRGRQARAPERSIPQPPAGTAWTRRKVQTATDRVDLSGPGRPNRRVPTGRPGGPLRRTGRRRR